MEMTGNDWRLLDQDQYLKNKTLKKIKFIATDIDHDHTHCAFCWEKFSEFEPDLHDGFSTLDERYWICPDCFKDFKESFNWEIIETDFPIK